MESSGIVVNFAIVASGAMYVCFFAIGIPIFVLFLLLGLFTIGFLLTLFAAFSHSFCDLGGGNGSPLMVVRSLLPSPYRSWYSR